LTVKQTARVASKIIPKTTQDGIIPPRRRTSVRVPIISCEICWTEAREEPARGRTLCDSIRSSTQYVFATLKAHLRNSYIIVLRNTDGSGIPEKTHQQVFKINLPEIRHLD
jgi:hypothetical protein